MRSRRRHALAWALAALLPLLARPAAAQLFTPSHLSPVRSSDAGLHLSAGDGLALEGILRRERGIYDLGLRAGIADVDGSVMVLLGADYRNPLEVDFAPLVLAATGGAQVALGGRSGFGIDAGVSVGSTFTPEGIAVTPYLHPRIALVESLRAHESLGLRILADLGVEARFAPHLVGRLALGLGGPTADFSLGLAWR